MSEMEKSYTKAEIRRMQKQYRPVLYCSECGKPESEVELLRHHIKYPKFHDEEKTVWMCYSCHSKLHRRLRKEGKCNILPEELAAESEKCYRERQSYKNKGLSWRTKLKIRNKKEARKHSRKGMKDILDLNTILDLQ